MSPPSSSNKIDEWGRVIVSVDDVFELFYNECDAGSLNVLPDVKIDQYNEWCKIFNKLDHIIPELKNPEHSPEEEHKKRTREWFIPEENLNLDVRTTLLEMCETEIEYHRVSMEMDLYEERNLIPLLQLMFSLVEYFRKEKIVWGVGRGSSCASYCLFLIGVHKINSIKFGLDITII
jgi:DNA polymerase III alpha subunit